MKTIFKNETIQEMITEKESLVFENPIADYTPDSKLGIEKISLGDDYTQIDFVYISSKKYINGGWIQIESSSFIRPIGTNTRLRMLKAINIPIAPAKYYFKSSGQVHHFTLLFPAIPKNVKQIDIIEKLAEGTFFNFFRVLLQHNEPTLIRIVNEN